MSDVKFLYSNDYVNSIYKKRNKILAIYLVTLFIAVSSLVGILVFFALQPYGYEKKGLLKFLMYVIIVVFVLFSGLYLEIIFSRINKYKSKLQEILSCKKSEILATVLQINYQITSKNNVDFYTITILEWSSVRKDYVEHSILVDNEIKHLPFKENDIITLITANNVLIGYKDNKNEKKWNKWKV